MSTKATIFIAVVFGILASLFIASLSYRTTIEQQSEKAGIITTFTNVPIPVQGNDDVVQGTSPEVQGNDEKVQGGSYEDVTKVQPATYSLQAN